MRGFWAAWTAAIALAMGSAAHAGVVFKQPSYLDETGVVQPWRLVAGKWGYLTPLSQAAARALDGCPRVDTAAAAGLMMAPNRFDRSAALAVEALRACRKAWFVGAQPGSVPDQAWLKLLPGVALPSPLERTKLLAAGAAAMTPDYDRAVWAWGQAGADPAAILIWGPFKATAGGGCTLQKALTALMAQPATAQMAREHFKDEAALLAQLLDRSGSDWCARQGAVLKPVFDDPDRREGLRVILAGLSAHAEVRAGYDAYFLGSSGYLAGRMARYYALYQRVGLTPSEIDFAFFLDRSLDYPPLTDALIEALVPKVMQGGATNWRARRVIANETPFTSEGARTFQIGRDAVYWIDAVGQGALTAQENAAWVRNSRLKASDVGLTERPYAPPCTVVFLSGCAGGRP